jgi:hypothetical protein
MSLEDNILYIILIQCSASMLTLNVLKRHSSFLFIREDHIALYIKKYFRIDKVHSVMSVCGLQLREECCFRLSNVNRIKYMTI